MQQTNFVQDLMKTQMLVALGTSTGFGGQKSSFIAPIINIVALNLYERLAGSYTTWFPAVKAFCCRRQRHAPSTPPPPSNKEIKSMISCERIMSSPSNTSKVQNNAPTQNNSRMDSVIHYITTIPAIRNLICVSHHDYLPHEFEPVQVENDLYFKLQKLRHTDGQVEIIEFILFSYDHEVQYLQSFVDRCNVDYERRMANKLGTSLYFFDMMTQPKGKSRGVQNPLPTTHLMYTKHKFHTTRSFDNVFFEQKPKVANHVKFFLTRKDWYEKKGIPYTLGFMFHGDPGCGKTSTVKAIANTAHRHIVNIQLSEIKTKAQLRHLFFNDEIHVFNGTTTERYTIPVHERLYVIEDIDAMGDAVLRREWKKPAPAVKEEKEKKHGDPWLDDHEPLTEPIDLSFLLNLLDGTLESSGRIIAISSNFPERIDRALIRPGRIDMIVHFKKCNRAILQEMVNSFYDTNLSDWTDDSLEYKWTPAEVNQILFRNFDKQEEAIRELRELSSVDLYGFDVMSTEVPVSYSQFASTDKPLLDA